ncbi:hypothetical protein JTE90_008597 [Oedothorax gibbosus]|uniref:Phosphatidic acid phosphatase type 2/haloperoxidase domain-containing protein n=1 Tax=Oedothorax gibbosus TaxID=931172 RepID=A0AAV6U9M3_9ARAC|nr:hypothetical protein JTE90_008597 [Oedothorax gibbosus]
MEHFPFRTASLLFMLYSNSDFSTFGKDAAFFCEDESIGRPFIGDTVSNKLLFFVQIVVIGIIVCFTEILYKNKQDAKSKTRCRLLLKYYYSGLLFVLTFCEILKNCRTKLRPHFFSTCMPDMTNINCSQGLVTSFNCTGSESWLLKRDIYKSFPSGHAAISVYACIFICLYLNAKKTVSIRNLLNVWWSRLIPVLCFLWAVTCCVTRVLDNRHFWWDVLTGALVGFTGGFLTIHFALNAAANKARRSQS